MEFNHESGDSGGEHRGTKTYHESHGTGERYERPAEPRRLILRVRGVAWGVPGDDVGICGVFCKYRQHCLGHFICELGCRSILILNIVRQASGDMCIRGGETGSGSEFGSVAPLQIRTWIRAVR
jgi:hypothetical protein